MLSWKILGYYGGEMDVRQDKSTTRKDATMDWPVVAIHCHPVHYCSRFYG